MSAAKTKVCLVTCYRDPEYIRVRTLEKGLLSLDDVDLIIVRNTSRGILRYLQVARLLLLAKLKRNPDVYLVSFRGYEILPIVLLVGIGKRVVFDEFINLVEWLVYEHKVIKNKFLIRALWHAYRFMLRRCYMILTDTDSHTQLSSQLMRISVKKYLSVPVSTDENVFSASKLNRLQHVAEFKVLYYGSMLPLHGLPVILEAFALLRGTPIKLLLIGGGDAGERLIKDSQLININIEYRKWVNFNELPGIITASSLCLGGPFGDTFQSQYVITGKTFQMMALGAPLLIGENFESGIFAETKSALVVKQGDPRKLANSIRWAFDNQGQLKMIGRRGQKLYQKRFSSGVVGSKMQELIHSEEL